MRDMFKSVCEELGAMHSGKFVPYQLLSFMVVTVISLLFSLLFTHGTVYEAPVAVIDLDRTVTTAKWIDELDSSPYIRITKVDGRPADPMTYLAHDAAVGVLYFPRGLESALKKGDRSVSVGYFADDTNDAQNAKVKEELAKTLPEWGAQFRSGRVGSLGLGPQEIAATLAPVTVASRDFHNPTHSFTNGTTIAFVYFFSSIFYTLTLLMVVGRIRVTGQWERTVMSRSPMAMAARALPYAFFYTTAILTATAVLVHFGQLAFRGNIFAYAPSIFMTGLGFAWFAMALSWNTQNPGQGAAFMTYIVPPGFILGGATMATGFILPWGYWASYAFPLVWQYRFYRDMAARGVEAANMLSLYGAYLIYLLVLYSLLWLRFKNEARVLADDPR